MTYDNRLAFGLFRARCRGYGQTLRLRLISDGLWTRAVPLMPEKQRCTLAAIDPGLGWERGHGDRVPRLQCTVKGFFEVIRELRAGTSPKQAWAAATARHISTLQRPHIRSTGGEDRRPTAVRVPATHPCRRGEDQEGPLPHRVPRCAGSGDMSRDGPAGSSAVARASTSEPRNPGRMQPQSAQSEHEEPGLQPRRIAGRTRPLAPF